MKSTKVIQVLLTDLSQRL